MDPVLRNPPDGAIVQYPPAAVGQAIVVQPDGTLGPSGGGISGAYGLSNVRYADAATTVPLANQNGSENSPFASLNAAIDAIPGSGTVVCAPTPFVLEGTINVGVTCSITGDSAGPTGLTLQSIVATAACNLQNATVLSGVTTTAAFTALGCRVFGIHSTASVSLSQVTENGNVQCTTLWAEDASIIGNVTLSGAQLTLQTCTFGGASVITFSGAAGTIITDEYSYRSFLGAGGTVINGTVQLVRLYANLTQLAALNTAWVGAVGYVQTQRCCYIAVPVGQGDLAGIGVAWKRMPETSDPFWRSQPTWWIATTGSVEATGLDNLHPIPLAELVARWGVGRATLLQTTTVNILDDQSEPISLCVELPLIDSSLDIIGQATVALDAGAVTSFANIDHSVPMAQQLTTSLISNWTTWVGKRLRITSGTNADAVAWVASANPPGTNVGTARTSPWVHIDKTSASVLTGLTVPTNGDPISVETLPKVPAISLDITGPLDTTTGAQWPKRQWTIQGLDCENMKVHASGNTETNKGIIWASAASQTSIYSVVGLTSGALRYSLGCKLHNNSTPGLWRVSGNYNGCLFTAFGSLQILPSGFCTFNHCLVQGGNVIAAGPSSANDLQIFDAPAGTGSALNVTTSVDGTWQMISGSNLCNIGLSVGVNVSFRVAATSSAGWNLLGAVANVQLAAVTGPPAVGAVNLTYANFFAASKNDFSQNGVATLGTSGPGFVDVSVPYWDPSVQSLVVSRRTPSGTLGNFSTPFANRTNTSFRIQSDQVTETSTFDWQISPLGRNVTVGQI